MPDGDAGRTLPRVSPPRVFPVATRASRPPVDSQGSPDAYRQAGFVLAEDIEVAIEGLNLEGGVADGSTGARYRKQVVASSLGVWSRSWLGRLQAVHAVEWGNYVSAFPLVRAAADFEAAGIALVQTAAAEWNEWLGTEGIALAPAQHATAYRLASFRAAEVMAANGSLGRVYRGATDFTMPHFAITLLQTASDSTPERVLATFGDRDFHLGLAQIALGWVLELGAIRARTVLDAGETFGIPDAEALERFIARTEARLAARDRCRVEQVEVEGASRYLVHGWRRIPSAQPKKILL